MADIIDVSKYKLQKKNKVILSRASEEEIANRVLDSLNYNNRNIAIPIVKIARNYGLKVYRDDFYKNGEMTVAGKLFVEDNANKLGNYILVDRNDYVFEQRIVVARMLGCYLIDIVKGNLYNNTLKNSFSDILDYRKIYDKYEEFILNILAPSQIFVR